MSVVTQSAYEPAAEAFVGFCGTERQKRELRRLQLLELHNLQQPGFLERNSGGDERARQATSPSISPPLPSDLPAVVATCDYEDADAVKLQRCIASVDVSSENGRFRLAGEILAACSKIVRVPVANVVLHYGYECACQRTAALDSDMSPGQQLWFPKIANKPIVQLLLDMAQSSEVDETRAIICSSLEHIAFFESGRFIAASQAIVPVLLHMAHRVQQEHAVVALLRIFPAFICGARTRSAREAFVSLGNATLRLGCQHLELLFVAFQQLTFLTHSERSLTTGPNNTQIDTSDFLMHTSVLSVLTSAAQLDNLSSRTLDSLCGAFLEFTQSSKGVKLMSKNDAVVTAFLRLMMKIDDPHICFNMTCNLARIFPLFPKSRCSEVLQVVCRCSTVAPFVCNDQHFKNNFNTNILTILRAIAVKMEDLDSDDGPLQTLMFKFRPFAITLLRMAACTDGWSSIKQKKPDNCLDKHHVLNCKMAALYAAADIIKSLAYSSNSDDTERAKLMLLQCSTDEIGCSSLEFQSIESLLVSVSAAKHKMFRHVRDDHLNDDDLGPQFFYLLRLRSFLYPSDDPNLESNNRAILAALSKLKCSFSENSKSLQKDAKRIDLIFELALSSRQFDVFFAREISSVHCKNFKTISRIFATLSQIDGVDERSRNVFWRKAMLCSVFKALMGVLISSCFDAGFPRIPQIETGIQPIVQPPTNVAPQSVCSRVRVVNWNNSEVVFSFTADVALAALAVLACNAFDHQPGSFDILCAHSRTVFTPAQHAVTLSEVGLLPTGKVYLQERQADRLARIEIVDLAGIIVTVHFEVTATLNDIACYVRDNRRPFDYYKKYPKKSFCIVVNGALLFQESSFPSTTLLQAGLLPGGRVSFQKMRECFFGGGCETRINKFLSFAKSSVVSGSCLFSSDTAGSLITLLRCSLCWHAQMRVMSLVTKLLSICSQDLIASFRHILYDRIDQLSKVNIRCYCERDQDLGYDIYFARIKDAYGENLLKSLQQLRLLPNSIDDADFFEMVDRIAASRMHLYRHSIWYCREHDAGIDLTNALADLFVGQLEDLIQRLSRTSPDSPDFMRVLSKIITIAVSRHKKIVMSPDTMLAYVSAIRNARDAPSQCCPDAALIFAYIFSLHLKKDESKFYSSIKNSNWNLLRDHFHIVADIFCAQSNSVVAPMIIVCSQFIKASCKWFGPHNMKSKRDLNAELGHTRLSALVSASIAMSSHCSYLSMDASARFFNVIAGSQMNQHLTDAVPEVVLRMLSHFSWDVQKMGLGHRDDANRIHALEAVKAFVSVSHLQVALLNPSALDLLSTFYFRDKDKQVLDIFDSMQSLPHGREIVGSSLSAIETVFHALNNGNDAVQSKALKILDAALQQPVSLVWLQAPGLKELCSRLMHNARDFFCVDRKKRKAAKKANPVYFSALGDTHILFSSDTDVHSLFGVLISCSSPVPDVDNREPIFEIRDVLVFMFDLFNKDSCNDVLVSCPTIMSTVVRVLTAAPPSLVSDHILNYFDDNSGSVPTGLLCALNILAKGLAEDESEYSGIGLLCTAEMKACLIKVGRNPIVSSSLEIILTQEANETFLHLESLKPAFKEYKKGRMPPKKKLAYSSGTTYESYKEECNKFEAYAEQRLNGLAYSSSLYELIETLAFNDRNGVFFDEDLLCLLIDAVRPLTNLCAINHILRAIRFVFGKHSHFDTHDNFSVATFGKLRRFLFAVVDQIHRIFVGIGTREFSKRVKAELWREIFAALSEYVALLLHLYPYRSFRRVLTQPQPNMGGEIVIATIVKMLRIGSNVTFESAASVNLFQLFSKMMLSPVQKQYVASFFQAILKFVISHLSRRRRHLLRNKIVYEDWFEDSEYFSNHWLAQAIAFMSNFVRDFPEMAVENASRVSKFGVFSCRMASQYRPFIFRQTCDFVNQLLQLPLSNSVYARFASASFGDLAALCDRSLKPASIQHPEYEESMSYGDKCSVVGLIQTVSSCGELHGDSIKLALLRMKWGCSETSDEDNFVRPVATQLLTSMGLNKDNFAQLLPTCSQAIAADAQCYLEDKCFADDGESLECQVSCCGCLSLSSLTCVAACVRSHGTSLLPFALGL